MKFAHHLSLSAATALALATVSPATAQSNAKASASSVTTAPATNGAMKVPPIQYQERVLKNGLHILSLRDPSTPNVAVSVWYNVGSKHDPEKRSGFAHLFEHILSRKTVNMPYNMINRLTEDVGGVRNASTWYDRTNYYEIVPAQYLETMLWTHAERMARPVVDKEVFETERNVVKEELRQRVLAPPYGRLFSFAVGENAFDIMPHRRPTIGSIEDLEAATLEDARAFHQAFYGPDTATLIVAGNYDEAGLQALVDKYFAAIPRRANPISLDIKARDKKLTTSRRINATAPNVPLPVVGAIYKVPGASHADAAALEVMEAILQSGNNSRFYKQLVQSGLATAANSQLNFTKEAGYLAPYAMVATGQDSEKVAGVLDTVLAGLVTNSVTDAELSEAKNELLASSLQERETFSGRAFEMGEALVRTGDPKAADNRLAAIGKVTKADIARVAKLYLDPKSRVEIRYTNGDGNPAGWANPTPLPKFVTVPAVTSAPNQLADEATRQAPPSPAAAPTVAVPNIVESRLNNGVRVVAVKTGNVPLATLNVVIGGGASTDPAGRAGLAGMTAGLASRGTTTRTADQIAAALESLGASMQNSSSPDGTVFSVTVPASNLDKAADIVADLVRNANFPDAEVALNKKRTVDGLSVAMKDPGQIATMVMQPLLYGSAPYASQSSGTLKSVTAMTRDDMLQYRQKWWQPSNMAVVVTGGVDPASANALANRMFGDWKPTGEAPVLPMSRAGESQSVRTVVIDLPGAGQSAVMASVRGLSRSDTSYPDLMLANSVLGVGSNGRLFTEVRSKRALSYGAYSSMPSRADVAVLSASAQTKNETATEVAEIFLNEFKRLGSEPLTADTLAKRKAFLDGANGRQMESGRGFNPIVSGLLLQGLSPNEAFALSEKLGKVTPQSANAIATRMISPDKTTLVIVGDSAKFIDKLRVLRPDVVVIPIDKLDLDSPTLGAAR